VTGLLAALLASAPTMVLPPSGPAGAPAWVAEAVAELLPHHLQELGVAVVDRAERLRAHESLEIPAHSLTRATSVRVAEALGAGRVVVGRFGLADAGSRLELSLQILDVERGSLSAPILAVGPVEGIQALLRGLAWDVATAGTTPPDVTREAFLARAPKVPLGALRALASGLAAPEAAARMRLLKQALAEHPGYDEAALNLGRMQVEARDSAAAVETLSRIPAASPLTASARFLEGVACLDLGRYREARLLFSGLAVPEPSAPVLNNYGLALLRGGPDPEGVRASEVLRRALDLDPGLHEPPLNLGWALFLEGETEAAAFWLQAVLRDEPSDTHARLALVWALRASGRAEEAEAEWRTLIEAAPAYAGMAAADPQRRLERVIPWERRLVLDQERWGDRQYAASHLGRGEKLQEAGDLEAARRELRQAAQLDPYSDRAHLLLARLEARQGNGEAAALQLRMALWIRDEVATRLELMRLLGQMGRSQEARAQAERVLEADAANAEARALLEGSSP
jgi:Flp pilus assembly protein TadD